MKDIELINLASKASGFEYTHDHNPLISDELALRLAVKLKMSLDLFDDYIAAGYTPNDNECLQIEEPHENAPYTATRRAIVRAAAEIGKNLG